MPIRRVVFVVDDDSSIRKGLRRLLKAYGFDTELFESVEDFEGRANLRDAICLVLDVNLNGASGIDLRQRLTVSGVSLPVIFITADDSDATRHAAMEAGCVACLIKPFSAEQLMGAIAKASAGSRSMQ